MCHTICRLVLVALLTVSPIGLFASDELSFETVAFIGLDAPGIPGANFQTFFTPAINDSNQVIFGTLLQGIGVDGTNQGAIFTGTADSLSLVAREGDLPPGLGGDTIFLGFGTAHINELGQATFRATVSDSVGFVGDGIFSNVSGSLELVALEGDSIPDAFGVEFASIADPAISVAEHIVFSSTLPGVGVDESNNEALFFKDSNKSLTKIARAGDLVPGLGVTSFLGPFNHKVNSSGNVLFAGSLSGGEKGIVSWAAGLIEPVVLTGDDAPDTPLGTNFFDFALLSTDFSETGRIAFSSTLSTGQKALYSDATGTIQLIAVEAETAPSIPLNPEFSSFRSVTINDNGETAFIAEFAGQVAVSDHAIYIESDGVLELVARQGDVAPGTEPGITIGDMGKLSLNNARQLAFGTSLDGDGQNDPLEAIYVYSGGELNLVARHGDMFDVDDDPMIEDLRQIGTIALADGADSLNTIRPSLNDSGELAFYIHFFGIDQGIFVAKVGSLLGDVNGDGSVDLLDIGPFVEALTNGVYVAAADANQGWDC